MRNVTTPELWNRKASLYNMSSPELNPTWRDIYNHLKPYADQKAAPAIDDVKARPLDLPTKETFSQFQTWARGPDEFTDRDTLKKYIIDLGTAIDAKRTVKDNKWRGWIDSPGRDGKPNPQGDDFTKIATALLTAVAQAPVTKKKVDNDFYNWLNTADFAFSEYLKLLPR
jgi:hypothetical protein